MTTAFERFPGNGDRCRLCTDTQQPSWHLGFLVTCCEQHKPKFACGTVLGRSIDDLLHADHRRIR